jgi:predicted CXXCH cytochrome family protein
MVLVAGCASNTKHKWLSFFFDGVPSPRGVPTPLRPEHPQAGSANLSPGLGGPPSVEPLTVVHQPYADRKCTDCHASNYSQRLKGEVSAICASCHKMFLVKAKYSHAPIEDGQCTLCHLPHQAKEKFLLVKNIRELCFDCHEPEDVFKTKTCEESPDRPCTACHDPHQENRKFLLHSIAKKYAPARNSTPDK